MFYAISGPFPCAKNFVRKFGRAKELTFRRSVGYLVQGREYMNCLLRDICYFATMPNHISNCSFCHQTQPHHQLPSLYGAIIQNKFIFILRCHMSFVLCRMLPVTCHMSLTLTATANGPYPC